MKFIYVLFLFLIGFNLFSQRGKDGIVNITTTNTVVNLYTSLIQNVSAGSATISVASSASYTVGDLIFIIQMQGARVNAGKDTLYPALDASIPTNTTFGAITNYDNCGNNEFAQIAAVPNSTTIVLDCGLKYNYDYFTYNNFNPQYGNTQVIKVPRYYSLTISGSGSITCPQWNGSTGGIAVVEVETNAVLNSSPSFNVSGKGFRGGATENSSTYGGDRYGSIKAMEGGYKGESIAGDTSKYKFYAAVFGRGAIANGGGGGCAHNAGGGGGANAGNILNYNGKGNPVSGYNNAWNQESSGFSTNTSSGGGRGGYSWASNSVNPASNGPGVAAWGGDNRRNMGGFGGHPLDYSTGRLFIGGGGGAGDGNDNQSGAGGNGGGMVYMVCYGDLTGSGTLVADGAKGGNSVPGCSTNDAAGGGGGGGTIILNVTNPINLTAPTALSAKGGDGGNQNFNCFLFNSTSYGPGASGGGGYIATSGGLPSNNISAGINGIVSGNTSNVASSFPPNGATKGGTGLTGSIPNYTLTTSPNQTICTNQSITLTAISNEPGASINWFNTSAGGNAIATGTAYAIASSTTTGTYTLYAGACPGTYRQPIVITTTSVISIAVNNPTICAGQTATLVANGASTYTWSTGSNSHTISVSPTTTTIYTVSGSSGTCNGISTSTVIITSSPTMSINSATLCLGKTATLVANGASSYTWNTGATTNSVIVSPTVTTSYSVVGFIGGCLSNTITSVNVAPSSNIIFSTATSNGCAPLCSAFESTVSLSCSSMSYNFGDGSTANTNNPTHCYTAPGNYTVTATCIDAVSGCSTTYTLPSVITVYAQPTANFTIQEGNVIILGSTINLGSTITLHNNSLNATNYKWNLCDASSSTLANVSVTAANAGNCCMELIAYNTNCADTAQACILIVKEEPFVFVPNVFTPNNDKNNDVFKIKIIGVKSIHCAIYDRWGLKLYEWTDLNSGWDGNTKNGDAANAGTYFYVLEYADFQNNTTTRKGFLTLFRD